MDEVQAQTDERTNTTTAAPARQDRLTDEMMQDQMSRLNREALVDLLERFGYVAQAETSKADLIRAVLTLHQTQLKESHETVEKAVAETVDADEELVNMRFMSLESPNASYEFTYAGPKGLKLGPNGKAKPAPKWCFMHNRTYRVPRWMVRHLNSLMVPADRVVETDAQGFIQSLYSGETSRQPRFSCTMELTPEQERRAFQKG